MQKKIDVNSLSEKADLSVRVKVEFDSNVLEESDLRYAK
jgi:hypothetical protein